MIVAELIEILNRMPSDLTVALVSVNKGDFFKIQEIETCEEFETGQGEKFCGLDVDGSIRSDDELLN